MNKNNKNSFKKKSFLREKERQNLMFLKLQVDDGVAGMGESLKCSHYSLNSTQATR